MKKRGVCFGLLFLLSLLGCSFLLLSSGDRPTPTPTPEPEYPTLEGAIQDAASFWGINHNFLKAIVYVESSYGKRLKGRVCESYRARCLRDFPEVPWRECARAQGPAHVMGHYGLRLGVKPDDSRRDYALNLHLAGHKLAECGKYPDFYRKALCYYGFGRKKGDNYPEKVMAAMRRFEAGERVAGMGVEKNGKG